MLTTIAINKGNYVGISDAFSVPILTDMVIQEQDVSCLLKNNYIPSQKVIKVAQSWTEVRNVQINILNGRIFLTGLAYQYKTLVGENDVLYCESIIDPFHITSSIKGLIPGMRVNWQVTNKEYTKILTPRLISYLNELTFHLEILKQETLWVKTRAVISPTKQF